MARRKPSVLDGYTNTELASIYIELQSWLLAKRDQATIAAMDAIEDKLKWQDRAQTRDAAAIGAGTIINRIREAEKQG